MLDPEFKLQPSTIHICLLVFLLFISSLIVLVVSINLFLKLLLLVWLGWYGKKLMEHALLKHPNNILSLKWLTNKEWLVQTKSGDFQAEIEGSSTITNCCSLLRFKLANQQRISSFIVADSLDDRAQYRHLLKWVRLV